MPRDRVCRHSVANRFGAAVPARIPHNLYPPHHGKLGRRRGNGEAQEGQPHCHHAHLNGVRQARERKFRNKLSVVIMSFLYGTRVRHDRYQVQTNWDWEARLRWPMGSLLSSSTVNKVANLDRWVRIHAQTCASDPQSQDGVLLQV